MVHIKKKIFKKREGDSLELISFPQSLLSTEDWLQDPSVVPQVLYVEFAFDINILYFKSTPLDLVIPNTVEVLWK